MLYTAIYTDAGRSDVTQRRSLVRAAQMALHALHQRLFDQTGFAVRCVGQRRNGRDQKLLVLVLVMIQLLLVVLRSDGRNGRPPPEESAVEFAPRVDRFVRPDPEARRDAHHQGHEVFEHEDGEIRTMRQGAAQSDLLRLGSAAGTGQSSAPFLLEGHLVGVAAEQNGGRNGIQDAEDANADHQLLQFLGFGSTLSFEDAPDASQT